MSLPLSLEGYSLYIRKGIKKAPKGKSESPWSLHMISFWKITFINSPEVQRQVVWSKGMVGYDSRKIAQNRTGVKRNFRHPFSIIFQTQDRKGNHNLLGVAQANQKLLMRAITFKRASLNPGFDIRKIAKSK